VGLSELIKKRWMRICVDGTPPAILIQKQNQIPGIYLKLLKCCSLDLRFVSGDISLFSKYFGFFQRTDNFLAMIKYRFYVNSS